VVDVASGSLDRLADLVGRGAFAGTVIRRDGEIVHPADGQTVHSRCCDGSNINGSCIEAGRLSDVDFITADCASGGVPPECCRGRS
jgi:hypothetical protein